MTDTPVCIDISHWQGSPDFAKVKAAGVIACIMKASEGTDYVDPSWKKNFVAATAAGIACATYHWLKHGNAAAQIAFYLKNIDAVPGERVIIDYEEPGVTIADLHEAVQALLADPRKLQVTVYSGNVLKEQLGYTRDALLAENTDLWLAQYTTGTPSWPHGTYAHWALWQYSESGRVDGITGSTVDLNRFDGSNENLLKWISPATKPVEAEQKPAAAKLPVSMALTIPDNVALTITVNGKIVA